MKSVLVVGSTGQLGRAIVAGLREAGLGVRALVRPGRDNELTQGFASSGVEIVRGDLKVPASLEMACRGVDVVVSTATTTSSQSEADSIETVDRIGNLSLVDAAETAKVSQFVFVSFADIAGDFALKRAKASVEARLRSSDTLAHTILKPAYFMESWLPGLGPQAAPGPCYVFGTGRSPVSWIALGDVARCAVSVARNPTVRNSSIDLGGPEALSQLDVFELFQGLGAPKADVFPIAEGMLQDELKDNASNPLAEAFAALKLGIARGLTVHTTPTPELSLPRMSTVREFVVKTLEAR